MERLTPPWGPHAAVSLRAPVQLSGRTCEIADGLLHAATLPAAAAAAASESLQRLHHAATVAAA